MSGVFYVIWLNPFGCKTDNPANDTAQYSGDDPAQAQFVKGHIGQPLTDYTQIHAVVGSQCLQAVGNADDGSAQQYADIYCLTALEQLIQKGGENQRHQQWIHHQQYRQGNADQLGQADVADQKTEHAHSDNHMIIFQLDIGAAEIITKRCGQADSCGQAGKQYRNPQNQHTHCAEHVVCHSR